MWKGIMLLLVFICTVSLCSIEQKLSVPIAYGNDWGLDVTVGKTPPAKRDVGRPVKHPPIVKVEGEYTVVAGDTLDDIARKFGTTWQDLWSLNRDQIIDPNVIQIGQKLRITGKAVVPVVPQLTREQKIDKLAKFMFKTSGLRYEPKSAIESCMQEHKESLLENKYVWMANQRAMINRLYELTRQHEIWQLSAAIVDTSKDEETFFRLVGLAWQETHFVNQRGKKGEVSFFQFLPSTIRERFQLDDIGLVKALWDLENDPKIATVLALDMMTEYKWNCKYWNGGEDFSYNLNNKIFWFKSEWRK